MRQYGFSSRSSRYMVHRLVEMPDLNSSLTSRGRHLSFDALSREHFPMKFSALIRTVTINAALLGSFVILCGFASDQPLLTVGESKTPWADPAALVSMDKGQPAMNADNQVLATWYRKNGVKYEWAKGAVSMSEWDSGTKTYLMQASGKLPDGHDAYHYFLALIPGHYVAIQTPPTSDDHDFADMMKGAGVNFRIVENEFYFDKRSDLDEAFRLVRRRSTSMPATIMRVVSGKEEAAAFKAELDDLRARKMNRQPSQQVADFPVDGYSDGSTMQEVYDDHFTTSSPAIDAIYAQEFMAHFAESQTPECRSLVRTSSYLKAEGKASMETARTGMGDDGLVQQVPTHDLLEIFKQSFNGGAERSAQRNRYVQRAVADSALFEQRYGCTSDISKRFLSNLSDLVDLY